MNDPPPDQILQVGMGFLASKTLLSAIEMELFTELADRSEPLEMLQGRLGRSGSARQNVGLDCSHFVGFERVLE